MSVPRDPSWCSSCRGRGEDGPCADHRGPDGRPAEYRGRHAYEPSKWVLGLVGARYVSAQGITACTGYDPRTGFAMESVTTGQTVNVTETAIGLTYHRVRMSTGARALLEIVDELGRMPNETEAGPAMPAARELLQILGYIGADNAITDAGRAAVGKLKAAGRR